MYLTWKKYSKDKKNILFISGFTTNLSKVTTEPQLSLTAQWSGDGSPLDFHGLFGLAGKKP